MDKLNSNSLKRLCVYLLNSDQDMTVSRFNVFLRLDGKNDVLVRDLVRETGLNQSTIARTLAILSDKPQRGKHEGLGWVRMDPDPDDPRRVLVNVTPKGKKVFSDIEALA